MDEFKERLDELLSLIRSGKYTRIAVFSVPGEGKTTLIEAAGRELGDDSGWNIYSWEESSVEFIKIPYVLSIIDPETDIFDAYPEKAPEIIYVLSYSDEYKQRMTGVDIGPGKTFREHARFKRDLVYQTFARNVKTTVSSLPELKEMMKEAEVETLQALRSSKRSK